MNRLSIDLCALVFSLALSTSCLDAKKYEPSEQDLSEPLQASTPSNIDPRGDDSELSGAESTGAMTDATNLGGQVEEEGGAMTHTES